MRILAWNEERKPQWKHAFLQTERRKFQWPRCIREFFNLQPHLHTENKLFHSVYNVLAHAIDFALIAFLFRFCLSRSVLSSFPSLMISVI